VIIQQLIAVAKAILELADKEEYSPQELCHALGMNPGFREKVLSQYDVDYVSAHMRQKQLQNCVAAIAGLSTVASSADSNLWRIELRWYVASRRIFRRTQKPTPIRPKDSLRLSR